jgi:phage terminase large subunit-like protein
MTTEPLTSNNLSPAERLAMADDPEKWIAENFGDDQEAIARTFYDWRFWARPNQIQPEGKWSTWLIMSGRGYGKTRVGAETVRIWEEDSEELFGIPRGKMRIALVGRTAADVRDTMIEGESGILATSPPWNYPIYQPSIRRLTWPSGTIATLFSAEEPDLLRGPQHHAAWGDEVATWKKLDTYDNLQMGLRLGKNPKQIFTTTPRPIKLIRDLVRRSEEGNENIRVTRGSTYENRSNLAETFYDDIIYKYEGTRTGRQELMGELLWDVEGSLWGLDMIDKTRVTHAPALKQVAVAIDPAGGGPDEIGIVATGKGVDDHWYVLADKSLRGRPETWAMTAVHLYHQLRADYIVAEKNYGGDMVEAVIKNADPDVPVKMVTASRGKHVRAQPASLAYERELVHHVGTFSELEDQMCNWVPEDSDFSPDRLDALIWGLTSLKVGRRSGGFLSAIRI